MCLAQNCVRYDQLGRWMYPVYPTGPDRGSVSVRLTPVTTRSGAVGLIAPLDDRGLAGLGTLPAPKKAPADSGTRSRVSNRGVGVPYAVPMTDGYSHDQCGRGGARLS